MFDLFKKQPPVKPPVEVTFTSVLTDAASDLGLISSEHAVEHNKKSKERRRRVGKLEKQQRDLQYAQQKRASAASIISQSIAKESQDNESDDDSSAGASDDDTEEFGDDEEIVTESTTQEIIVKPSVLQALFGSVADSGKKKSGDVVRKQKEQQLQAELKAVTEGLDDDETIVPVIPVVSVSQPKKERRNALAAMFGFGKQIELDESVVVAQKAFPPKTEQQLADERRKKQWEEEQEIEKERLKNEPAIVKEFRKTWVDVKNVIALLNVIFSSSRFGNIRQSQYDRLITEMNGDARKLASMNKFDLWQESATKAHPDRLGFLDACEEKIASLSALWEEVLRFNTMAEGESYEFSLQPLEKLRYFYEAINELLLVEKKFHAYMTGSDYNESVLEKKQPMIEKLIATVALFSARIVMLSKLIDALKTRMDDARKMQLQLRGVTTMDLSHEIIFEEVKYEEEFQAVKPEWRVNVETAEEAVRDLEKELGRLEGSIKYPETDFDIHKARAEVLQIREERLPLLKQKLEVAQFAQPAWQQRLDAVVNTAGAKSKILAVREMMIEAHETGENIVADESVLLAARAQIATIKKELIPLRKEIAEAHAVVELEVQKDIQAQRDVYDREKASKAKASQDLETTKAEQQEAIQLRKAVIAEASKAATQYLSEFFTRPGAVEALTLFQPVQAVLPTVSVEMLKLWLSDQTEGLSPEDAAWLSDFIEPEARELTFRLSIAPKVTILLEDCAGHMLEVVSIHLDSTVRGSLAIYGQDTLSYRTRKAYITEVNGTAEDILAIKAGSSSVSERATALLQEIARAKVEYAPHSRADLAHMNKKTFALFGLYLLLYLQDAPKHNFSDIDVYNDTGSSSRPGAGSRFLRTLMKNVQKELGYHLRHCKVIYDAMNERNKPAAKAITTRSSVVGLKTASTAYVDETISSKFSRDLEYIFQSSRTVTELEKPAPGIKKIGSIKEDNVAQDILVRELTGRYLTNLHALMMEENLPEVDRKRMKRIVELMEQLPYEKRRQLMDSPVVQLFITREQMETYKRSSTGQKRSSITSVFAGASRGLLKATGVDRKEDKLKFFVEVFEYLKSKFIAASNGTAAIVEDAFATQTFILNFYEKITHKEEYANVGEWAIKNILAGVGMEALDALMWLPNDVLDDIFLGAGIGARTVREMKGVSEAAFNNTSDSGNNSADEDVSSNVGVMSSNELMIVLAFQAAVLSFDTLMLQTKNEKLIVMASESSWFLQLRSWEVVMVANGVLPEFVQGRTAMQNRVVERNMLKIIDNMMENVASLADGITGYFSQTDSKILHDTIEQMPDLLKAKSAFVLVSGFFAVHYEKLASIKSATSTDKTVWKGIANYFWHILAMADFTLNKDDKAMIFAIAVNFLFANPAFLKHSRIEGVIQADQTKHVIPNTGNSLLDASLYVSSAKITLVQESEEVNKARLSTTKAAHFVYSVTLRDPVERITLQDALVVRK